MNVFRIRGLILENKIIMVRFVPHFTILLYFRVILCIYSLSLKRYNAKKQNKADHQAAEVSWTSSSDVRQMEEWRGAS